MRSHRKGDYRPGLKIWLNVDALPSFPNRAASSLEKVGRTRGKSGRAEARRIVVTDVGEDGFVPQWDHEPPETLVTAQAEMVCPSIVRSGVVPEKSTPVTVPESLVVTVTALLLASVPATEMV